MSDGEPVEDSIQVMSGLARQNKASFQTPITIKSTPSVTFTKPKNINFGVPLPVNFEAASYDVKTAVTSKEVNKFKKDN